jgi:hypothetical protein
MELVFGGYAKLNDANDWGVALRGGLRAFLSRVGSKTAGALLSIPRAELALDFLRNHIELRGSLGLAALASIDGKLDGLLVDRGAALELRWSTVALLGSYTQVPRSLVGPSNAYGRYQARGCWLPNCGPPRPPKPPA